MTAQPSQIPPVSKKLDAPVKRLNGSKVPAPENYQKRLDEINRAKARIAEENEQRSQEMAELVSAEQEAWQKHIQELRAQKAMYRNMAVNYRQLAKEAESKEQGDELLRYAMECDRDADLIIIEGEPEETTSAEPAQKVAVWEKRKIHTALAVVQLVALGLILLYCYGAFEMFRESMLEQNKELIKQAADNPGIKLLNPYDESSFQKFILESFVEFMDLPKALLKMLIFAPFMLYYLYRYFWKDFFSELTAWQRCQFLLGLFGLFLLHSALSHLITP